MVVPPYYYSRRPVRDPEAELATKLLAECVRNELTSRKLIDWDEDGHTDLCWVEKSFPHWPYWSTSYCVMINKVFCPNRCIIIGTEDRLVVPWYCGPYSGSWSPDYNDTIRLSDNSDSFDRLAGFCATHLRESLYYKETAFCNTSELRWYLQYRFPEYKVTCDHKHVIISDSDGFLTLGGADYRHTQPYVVDPDGQHIDIRGDYQDPGAWPAVKRFFHRLNQGKETPYPIRLEDLDHAVKQAMCEHGPGWQPYPKEATPQRKGENETK